MIRSAALLALLASPAAAQIVSPLAFGSSAPDTSNLATKADVANVQALIPSTAGLATTSALSTEIAARIAAISAIPAAPVASVNGLTGNVALTIPAAYTDAQALVAARGVTSLTSPNIAMPNGANLAHTIYQSRPSGGFLTISGTAETTVFAATGDGSLTIQPAAMFVGARFHLHDRGRATTGLANVSTIASKLKIGSTTLVTGTTLGLPASVTNIPFWSDIDCKVLSVGTSGSMLCYGGLHYGATASSGALVMTDMSNVTAVTINTTVAQTWDATVQLSSLIGSPSIIVYDASSFKKTDMAQTDITAIDAKTISINGVPIAGSGAPSGPVTKFSGLDADSVLALNGNILMGALPPGGVFTKFTDLDVAGLSVHEVPFGGGSVVTLAGLAISPTTATAGTAYNGTISGATAGSTITGTPPAGLTVNSGARTITGTPTAATSTPFNLVETLAGATGSPRTSSVTLTVAAAAGPPLSSSLVASWLPGNITGLSDNADITSIPDSKNGATMAPVSSGAKAKYRTGGLNGKPYVQVAIGQVYDLDPTGTPLKTAMDSGDFTVIHFLHNVTNTARSEVAVFSSYSNTAAVWHHATGARMGIHDLWAGGSAFFDSPYTDTGFASLAVSSTPSYPSYGIGVTQISINGGCIGSILGKQAGAVSRVSLFGIQGSPGSVYDGGSYAGNWYGTLIYNRRLTPPEIKQVTKWGYDLLGLTMPQTQLMGFSDSLLNGLDSDVPEYSPMAIAAGNLALSYGQWDNLSISGIFEDAITANISELTGLSAYAGSNPRAVVGEYYNSVTAAGVTGAQAATKTQAMVTAAKAGWSSLKIALQTAQASPRDTSNETNRTSYNNALVAGLTGVNALIRIDQNANIGTTGADTSGTYFKLSDPPHLTGTSSTSGYRTKAGLISTVVAAM